MIVPTKYYKAPTDLFREIGVSLAIWANHNLRASLRAMQDVCREIHDKQSLLDIEGKVRWQLLSSNSLLRIGPVIWNAIPTCIQQTQPKTFCVIFKINYGKWV